ncbi:MAG: hypothetical protein J3K34DRAFT_232319 [Monoraphidium minutum]|nr:MAG: hypothetical protein J3K34DRAFT_232319 [Monoraphidium minutum]
MARRLYPIHVVGPLSPYKVAPVSNGGGARVASVCVAPPPPPPPLSTDVGTYYTAAWPAFGGCRDGLNACRARAGPRGLRARQRKNPPHTPFRLGRRSRALAHPPHATREPCTAVARAATPARARTHAQTFRMHTVRGRVTKPRGPGSSVQEPPRACGRGHGAAAAPPYPMGLNLIYFPPKLVKQPPTVYIVNFVQSWGVIRCAGAAGLPAARGALLCRGKGGPADEGDGGAGDCGTRGCGLAPLGGPRRRGPRDEAAARLGHTPQTRRPGRSRPRPDPDMRINQLHMGSDRLVARVQLAHGSLQSRAAEGAIPDRSQFRILVGNFI